MIPSSRITLRSIRRSNAARSSISNLSSTRSSTSRNLNCSASIQSRNKSIINHNQSSFNSITSSMSSNLRSPSQQRPLATAATSTSSSIPNPHPFNSLPAGYTVHQSLPSTSSSPVAIFDKPLEISALDDRSYRLITLKNGLEVLLIHDEHTDKASAAMDVRVGHLSDPLDLQGLAHFCEHLLFMGTKKYPRENEYSEYLSQHSGSSNAYTGMENTNYFFDVGHNHLEGALDRFAQFFLEPLFDPSCSEREIRAVDSEHKKNLQSDAWRAFQLEKTLSDPNHPYSHFGTGNAKTLWDDPKKQGLDVRDELLKFHDRYYSANVMKLVVLGRESLDELTNWVVDKFSGVRNKGLAAPTFPSSPLGPSQLQTEVFFRTVKDIRMLDVTFPIPDQGPQFRAKPGQLLSHFIGHEGQGSILSYLKAQGWANHLSAGATNGADGFEFFKISVDLTEAGLANYEKVVAAMFKYLDLLRSTPVQKWVFDEVQQLCELAYRFKEKSPPSSYTSGLSSQMQQPYPREWILSGPYLTREFDLDLIQNTLQCLSPEKCRIFVASQQLPDGSKVWDSKERWYGTEYKLQPLNSSLQGFKANEFEGLSLPKPNSFIPSNFEVEGAPQAAQAVQSKEKKPVVKPSKRPVLIRNDPLARVWHKKDDQFFMPKANIFLLLRTPLIDATPANAVKSRLLVELIKDALTEYSYDAELAGLAYNIEAQADGIGFSLDGYNDKLPVLAKYILEEVAKFKVDPSRFEVVKDQVSRAYENFHLEAPYQHANYYTTYLLNERMWTAEEKLNELAAIQPDDVQKFLPDVLSRLHIEMLAHGNIKKQEALGLTKMAVDILGPKALSPSELVSPRSLILPKGSSTLWEKSVANPENVNSSIEYFCHVGDPSDINLRASLALLAQIAQEPCFDQLRTKEQLGYLVFSSVRKTIGMMGFRILVQSERDAPYVEGRIDAFFDTLKDLLNKMSPEEFESQKTSLIQKKKEVVKNLYEESSRYWFHIHSGYYDFLQRDLDVEALKKVNKEEVYDLFMKFIHPSSQERSKLSVHLNSKVKPIRFSSKAAEILEKESSEKGLPTPKEAFEMLKSQQPNVEIVKEHTSQSLSADKEAGPSQEIIDEILNRIDQLAKEYPFEMEIKSEENVEESNIQVKKVSVEDTIAFKAGLPPSKAAVPVNSWSYYQNDFDEKELPKIEESTTKANL